MNVSISFLGLAEVGARQKLELQVERIGYKIGRFIDECVWLEREKSEILRDRKRCSAAS